ncbi:MAG: Phosphoesterase [Ilumatobacteraceae bacterium]|nr:Phosphoesterase [Ilumatobacteraceae bacterium]
MLLITDTHLGPGQAGVLVDTLGGLLDDADLIVHAGDITDRSILVALGAFAPVRVVLGNNDRGLALPERIVFDVDGVEIAVVHDSGASAGRTARLRRWFPDADVVVFGHSHMPWLEVDRRADGQLQHHVNPGSAIQRRRAPHRTAAVLQIAGGAVAGLRHVTLPPQPVS